MRTEIKYNNSFPFSGQPTPFVGRIKNNISAGERWGAEENWSLVGQLTGCSLDSLMTAQLNLINSFSKDYQNLEIVENGQTISQLKYVEIDSINFDSGKYVKLLPYTINISCYPSGYFTNVFGITEPSNKWDLQENKDNTLAITHTISAKGFNTSNGSTNALSNAKNYVLGKTGLSTFPNPALITKYSINANLLSQVENINRFEGIYGVTETYILDQFDSCENGLLRYTIDQSNPQVGLSSATINGTIQGGINESFQLVKNRLATFDFYSNLMYGLDGTGNNAYSTVFNPNPVSKEIVEDQPRKLITFNYTYDDNKSWDTSSEYSISITSGDAIVKVSLNGNINGRGELKERFENAEEYFQNTFEPNKFSLVYLGYSGYLVDNNTTGVLNPEVVSSSVSYDKFNGVIAFSYEYNDAPIFSSSGLQSFEYSLSWTPPVRKIVAEPLIYQGGDINSPNYQITDINMIPRGTFSLNGSSVVKREVGITSGVALRNETENEIRNIFYKNSTGLSDLNLSNYKLGQTNKGNYAFNAQWSYDFSDVLGNTGNYSQIINL